MYTNTVVRCCTDVFWRIHFMFCLLSIYSTIVYIAKIKCIESQREWFIIEAQYLFYEPINDLLAVSYRLTTLTIFNTMCEVWSARCAMCVHFNECARRIITNFSTVFQKPWTIFYSRNYFVRFRALALLLTKLSTRSE